MMTLKMAIIAIMISSSAAQLNDGSVKNAVELPRVSEVVNYAVSKDTGILNTKEISDPQIAQIDNVAPAGQAMPAQQAAAQSAATIEDTLIDRPTINEDKTYEQCMKEAFDRLYEEINRMLDEVVDRCEEQF